MRECLGQVWRPTRRSDLSIVKIVKPTRPDQKNFKLRGRLSWDFTSWPIDIRNLNQVSAFVTKDGSEIRELLAYRNSVIRRQSLAEARVPAGGSTQEHYHPNTEEIYYIAAGQGKMRIEAEC